MTPLSEAEARQLRELSARALEMAGATLPPQGSGGDARERAKQRLQKWLDETPRYEGDDPRAVHYHENREALETALAALSQDRAEGVDPEAHLVARFSAALLAKLRASETKYGWQRALMRPDWREDLIAHLLGHVAKGDPIDVAAYAAFAWHHGWSLGSQDRPASDDLRRDVAAIRRWMAEGKPKGRGGWRDVNCTLERVCNTALASRSAPDGYVLAKEAARRAVTLSEQAGSYHQDSRCEELGDAIAEAILALAASPSVPGLDVENEQ